MVQGKGKSICAWGKCSRFRLQPMLVDSARHHLPQGGRFCLQHTEQITKSIASSKATRHARVEAWHAGWVARRMPTYEAAMADWQTISTALVIARGVATGVDAEIVDQAFRALNTYKPKKPE